MVLDYIDPGYGDKMVLTNGYAPPDDYLTIVENDTYNPFGGVSFTHNGTMSKDVFIPCNAPRNPFALTDGATETRSIKLSVYCDMSTNPSGEVLRIGYDGNLGYKSSESLYNKGLIYLILTTNGWRCVSRGSTFYPGFAELPCEGFHNITLTATTRCYTSGTTKHWSFTSKTTLDGISWQGVYDITSDSTQTSTVWPARFKCNSAKDIYISNVMCSPSEIPNQMQAVRLPTKNTVTDMRAGENGEYVATSVDQTLLQSIDTEQLTDTYGANTAISHIVVGAHPCYTSSAGTPITAISKEGNEITEHGNCLASTNTGGGVSKYWILNGQTLASLQNLQVGWKAGA